MINADDVIDIGDGAVVAELFTLIGLRVINVEGDERAVLVTAQAADDDITGDIAVGIVV